MGFLVDISEPLNGFAINSQGRHVWSLARMSLNVKVSFSGLHVVSICLNIGGALCSTPQSLADAHY